MRLRKRLPLLLYLLLIGSLFFAGGCTVKKSNPPTGNYLATFCRPSARPAEPGNFTATGNPGSILLQWSLEPSIRKNKLVIYRWSYGDLPKYFLKLPAGSTSFIDTDVTSDVRYFYLMIDKDFGGFYSDCQAMAYATPLPPLPAASIPPQQGPSFSGGALPLELQTPGPRYETCPRCNGKGTIDEGNPPKAVTCPVCEGTGSVRVQ